LGNLIHAAFHEPDTRVYRYVQGTVWGLILLSVALLVAEALLPAESPAIPYVGHADRVLLTLFAVEILLRVGSFRPPAIELFERPPTGLLRAHILGRLAFLGLRLLGGLESRSQLGDVAELAAHLLDHVLRPGRPRPWPWPRTGRAACSR